MSKTLKTAKNNATGVQSNYKNNNDNNGENKDNIQVLIKKRYSWLLIGTVCTILAVTSFVIIYNVVSGKSFTIDVATVLSTLLAFFSIFLSSFFYFKATEQSNQFYDRSYNHTRDIANTLSAMEGKFGEALRNIENYSNRINQRFDTLPLINAGTQDNILNQVQENMSELLEKIRNGELSKEEAQKYERRFKELQKENDLLKKKLNTKPIKGSVIAYLLSKLFLVNNNVSNFEEIEEIIWDDIVHGHVEDEVFLSLHRDGLMDIDGKFTMEGKRVLTNLTEIA